MSATSAYAQIVSERLEGLNPQRVPGYQSLIDFTERRLLPAVRTCKTYPTAWKISRSAPRA